MRVRLVPSLVLLAAWSLGSPAPVVSATFTAIGSGGLFDDPMIWSPPGPPGAGDTAIIGPPGSKTVIVNGMNGVDVVDVGGPTGMGFQTLLINQGATFDAAIPSVGPSGFLANDGVLRFNTGTVAGSLASAFGTAQGLVPMVPAMLSVGGSMDLGLPSNLGGPGLVSFFDVFTTIEMPGVATFTDGVTVLDGASRIANEGFMFFQGNHAIEGVGDPLPPVINNGSLVVQVGAMVEIAVPFSGNGFVGVVDGQLQFTNTVNQLGTTIVEQGGTLRSAGALPDQVFSELDGLGLFEVAGASVTISNPSFIGRLGVSDGRLSINGAMGMDTAAVTGGRLDVNAMTTIVGLLMLGGGTIGGNDTLNLGTQTQVTAGDFDGDGRVINQQELLLGPGDFQLGPVPGPGSPQPPIGTIRNGYTIENKGVITWRDRVDIEGATSTVLNTATGTINFEPGGMLVNDSGPGNGLLENMGLLRMAGMGMAEVRAVPLENTGMIDVQSGVLTLAVGALTSNGPVMTSAGGMLVLDTVAMLNVGLTGAGTLTTLDPVTVIGPFSTGDLNVGGGQLDLDDATSIAIGGRLTLTGAAILKALNRTVSLPGGLSANDGALDGPSVTYDLPPGTTSSIGGNLRLESAILQSRGTLTWTAGTITLGPSGENVLRNGMGGVLNAQANASILPTGLGTKLADNQGTWNVNVAAMGTSDVQVPFTNSGTLNVMAGVARFRSSYTQSAGTLALSGGAVTFDMGGTINGGSITGNGTITGDVTNAGDMSPGASAGKVTVMGSYTQASTGKATIEIAGLTAGTTYDQVAVTGAATLGGTLDVTFPGGFTLPPSGKVDLVTASSTMGSFANVTGLTSPQGKLLGTLQVGSSGVSVVGPTQVGVGVAVAGAANEVDVPYVLDSGTQCVSQGGIVLDFDADDVVFARVQGVRAGCNVMAAIDGSGDLDVDHACAAGTTGAVTLAQLVFTLQPGAPAAPGLRFDCTQPAALDCSPVPAPTPATCVDVEPVACVPGDIAPTGTGNGTFTLTDYVTGRRKLLLIEPSHPRDAQCADFHPGAVTCVPAGGAQSWCVTGDGAFALGDLLIMRRLLLQVVGLSCAACRSTGAAPTWPLQLGDVAPRLGRDGRVDVADVVQGLRWSVGLDEASTDDVLIGDVAPAVADGEWLLVGGNGRVDIADVVLTLRAAVGLAALRWPEHELEVRFEPPLQDAVAFLVRVQGWPAWTAPVDFEPHACEPDQVELEATMQNWGVVAVTDPEVMGDVGVAGVVRYRAPAPVDLARLTAAGEAVSSDLADLPLSVTLTPR